MIVPGMLECVPNFSEGRDRSKVERIVDAIAGVAGVKVLGWESDEDHHRSVVTFAGEPASVVEAAILAVGKAVESIRLEDHAGAHPRVGAADVVPFIPLAGSGMENAIGAAHRAGGEIWRRFGVPVYFYGAAARRAGRERLEKVRRPGFDGEPPDVGDIATHAAAGASVIGARDFLIAYNFELETSDVEVAKAVARKIRASSGGFAHVKALGLYLAAKGRAQVSMNLTRYRETDLDALFAAIEEEASRHRVRVGPGELIGFAPRGAVDKHPAFFRRAANFSEARVIETALET
jgi:glutamate formiminotransferase